MIIRNETTQQDGNMHGANGRKRTAKTVKVPLTFNHSYIYASVPPTMLSRAATDELQTDNSPFTFTIQVNH